MNTSDDKAVGYKNPPKASQFQPGQSGNPSGRPKKTASFRAELLEELGTLTVASENGESIELTKQRAIAKALVKAAIEGNLRAVTALLNFCGGVPADDDEEPSPEDLEILEDYKHRQNDNDSVEEEPPKPLKPLG